MEYWDKKFFGSTANRKLFEWAGAFIVVAIILKILVWLKMVG